MNTVLYVLAESIRHLGILTSPFLPNASEKILDQLSITPDQRMFKDLASPLVAGTTIPQPEGVFPRISVD
jgi:methionyl-tRNA synthetase